ncbi:hypothetical protein BDZ45DRAFT_695572 [Acephala macrosclerotiorum]|nr:hypothetical protein BDZ45DRAFT_695572 [Acephala macrosclerotiorum]
MKRDLNVINYLLPLVDIEDLRQNTIAALVNGEISHILLPSLNQLFHQILNHWTYPLRKQHIHETQRPLFRWLLLSYSNISVWNRFVVDVAEEYVGPTARARSREFIAEATQHGIQAVRDEFQYLIDVVSQNISFERDGGPLTINEKRNSQRTAIVSKIEGVSNFTVRKERMMRRHPGCLVAQLGKALENFERDLQDYDRDVRESFEYVQSRSEQYFRNPQGGKSSPDMNPPQRASRHTLPNDSEPIALATADTSRQELEAAEEGQNHNQAKQGKDAKLEENIARMSEMIEKVTELLQVFISQRDRRQHNLRRQFHSQLDRNEAGPSRRAPSTAGAALLRARRPDERKKKSSDDKNTDTYREMLETQRQIHHQLPGGHTGRPAAQATSLTALKDHHYDDASRDYSEADTFIAMQESQRSVHEQLRGISNVPPAPPGIVLHASEEAPTSSTSEALDEDSKTETSMSFEDTRISDMQSFGSGSTIKPTAANDNPFLDRSHSRSRGASILYDSDKDSEKISEYTASDSEDGRARSPTPRNFTQMEEAVSRIGASW